MTNNTTASALTDEQRAAINMAISVLTPLAMDEYGDALRALLTSPRAAVPDGWKLVPIEPTDQMMVKGGFSFCGRVPNDEVFPEVRKVWERLLDAAPDAPVAEISAGTEPNPSKESGQSEAVISARGFDAQTVAAPVRLASIRDFGPVPLGEGQDATSTIQQALDCPTRDWPVPEIAAQAVAADGADTDELQGIVEACEELGCPDGMTPRQFISDIWSLLIAWYQASSEGKIAVSDPAYHLVTATAALMGDERAAVSPATSESKCTRCGSSTAQACNERGCFYLESGEGEPATADKRAAQKYDHCDPGNWRDGNDAVGDYQAARTSQTAAPQANAADESEDAYVIRRLSETLADVCVTLRGDDPVHPDDPLNKIELVKRLAEVLRMEVELYRAQASAPAEAREPVAQWQTRVRAAKTAAWVNVTEEDAKHVMSELPEAYEVRALYERPEPADAGEAVPSFIRDVAAQKPVLGSSCGLCDSNRNRAQDLLKAAQGVQGGKGGE
ncbi:hypothetical protein [Burkholderia glumae]|uniref:hypothetical protein n=1 Tax=Burkholderia glumae TaxID=337 RepID=UPI0021506E51|nr:hypothetical protein [Burkholderia glumae]